jgi:hypothetical protein
MSKDSERAAWTRYPELRERADLCARARKDVKAKRRAKKPSGPTQLELEAALDELTEGPPRRVRLHERRALAVIAGVKPDTARAAGRPTNRNEFSMHGAVATIAV